MFGYIADKLRDLANYLSEEPKEIEEPKFKPLTKKTRIEVWQTYFKTSDEGECYCCSYKLNIKNWHCSHVIARDKKGTDEIENLRVCCPSCNLSMGNQNLYAYVEKTKLVGMASKNKRKYFVRHKSQVNDLRTKKKN